MCIPAFSGMNANAEKTKDKEATTMMELPDLEDWHYRIPIIVDTGDYNRTDCVLSQTINITMEVGGFGTFDENSVRVIETAEDGTPQYETFSQIRWLNTDNLDVEWIMNGTTPANTQRHYSIYFDILENGAKNVTAYEEYVTTNENSQHIWVYGTDYEIKIDKDRGGSREVKINEVPRKGYTLDKDWTSWCTPYINWGIKGASTTLVEDGPIYKTVKIVSSDNSQTIYWYFYPDKMKIIPQETYENMCFDTIADNLNNKEGILVWGDGTTENLTKDYQEYSRITNFFYILDPELDSSNDDVKGRSGFWADTIDNKNQTVINAGEKGTRWILNGDETWFGFAKNEVVRDVVLGSQNPPEITREYSWIVLESPVIEDEKVFENQVVIIKGDLTVKNEGILVFIDGSLTVHGNITVEEGGELYIVSSRDLLPPKPPELPPWPPLPPRPPRPPIQPPIRSAVVAGNISVNGKFFIAKYSLNMCGENDGVNGINISSTSSFECYNSTITAFSGEIPISLTNQKIDYEKFYYKFDIYGEAKIEGSKISYLYDGVRILNGSDASIQNSHISDSAGNGIFIDENCTPIIKGNTITNGGNAGIFIDPTPDNENEDGNNNNPPVQDNSTNSSNVVEAVNITYYDGYMQILFSDGSTTIVPYQPVEHNSTNFLLNGDFSDGLNYWTKSGSSRYGSWSDEVVYDSGNYPHILEYQVWNSRADGSGTGVYQPLNIDVTTYSSIYLECEVKVISNTLTDSGWWSNKYGGNGEMPGHIWITYKDFNDEDWCWSHGFLPNTDYFNRRNLNVVVRNQWYHYQSPNLVKEDTTTTNPYNQAITGHKMKTITGIYVGGNGWDFKGRFDCVKLWGTETAVNQPPTATVDTYQKVGEINKNVEFKGSGTDPDGSIVKYEWDFDGNGVYDWSSSTSASTTHAYTTPGTYFPVLRVTDNDGATDTDYLRVNVWDPDAYEVSGNTVTGCEYGISLGTEYKFPGSINIKDCMFYDNKYGLYCRGASPTVIHSYSFWNSAMDLGIFLEPIENIPSFPIIINFSYSRTKVGTQISLDTDSDGWYDWQELYVYGFNPYINDPDKESSDANFDGDGLTNIEEGDVYGTDPLNPDTDNDKINDDEELNVYGTNPLNPDTDFDTLLDGEEVNADDFPGATITTFSDSTSEKTLTFTSAGEQTIYIKIPVYDYSIEHVTTAKIDVSGIISWSNDIRVTTSTDEDQEPSIAIDQKNNIHITWYRNRGSSTYQDIMYTKLDRTGNTITPPKLITSYAGTEIWPEIAVDFDSSDNVHIIWQDNRGGIYYEKLDSQGNTLVDDKKVGGGTSAALPGITIDTDNNLHITWFQYKDPNWRVYYKKLDNNGNGLTSDKCLTLGRNMGYPSIDLDFQGNVHVVCSAAKTTESYQAAAGRIYYIMLNNAGSVLIAPTMINEGTNSDTPDVSVDSNDNLHVVWRDDNNVYYTKLNPGLDDQNGDSALDSTISIVNDKVLTTGSFPSLNIDSSDSIHMVFEDNRAGSYEVYYSKLCNDGSLIFEEQITSSDSHDSLYPRMDINSFGDLCVPWEDKRDSNSEIYFKQKIHRTDRYDLNSYIFTHTDEDDGIMDGYIEAPLTFYAGGAGNMEIFNLNIRVEPIITNPLKWSTDDDSMSDSYEIYCGVDVGGWQDPLVYNNRYAVLFIGGWDISNNHARYWNQLVDIYDFLTEDYKYDPNNIFVFYADGNTPSSGNMHSGSQGYGDCKEIASHSTMIDYDAKDGTITNFLGTTLNGIVGVNDFLYMWFYDHGDHCEPKAAICCWKDADTTTDDYILDDKLTDWCSAYSVNRIAFTFGTCFCGGFIDPSLLSSGSITASGDTDTNKNLNDITGDVVISLSQDYRVSNSRNDKGFIYHHQVALNPSGGDLMSGTATYTLGRFSGVSPDTDGNHFVSLYEAYIYANDNNDYTAANSGGSYSNRPQYWDSGATIGDLGKTTYL